MAEPELEADLELDTDISTQELLLAASNHDVEKLRSLLRTVSANVQDPDTGYTALHSAIAAFAPDNEPNEARAHTDAQGGSNVVDSEHDMDAAKESLKLLLRNGAIWNELDKNNETPGCIAYRLGLRELYDMMVDAGVRAEMLLNRLDDYERLGEGSEEDDDDHGDGVRDDIAEGVEKIDTAVLDSADPNTGLDTNVVNGSTDVKSEDYLRSELTFQIDRIMDSSKNAVMMSWEKDIMKRTAELLAPGKKDLHILNVGHGMGIIDEYFQSHSPSSHHIIEAHPGIIEKLKENGWRDKPNVTIHKGRWQDVLPRLIEQNIIFNVIYFDTFAEDYKALRDFFTEYVIGLLEPEEGRWSFFNGLGADRQICYDVYTKVSRKVLNRMRK